MEGICECIEHAFADTRHLVGLQLGDWPSDTKGSWGCVECLVADGLKVVIFPACGSDEGRTIVRHQKEILLLHTELVNIKLGTVSEDICLIFYFETHCDLKITYKLHLAPA